MARHRKRIDLWSAIIIFSLLVLDAVIWRSIVDAKHDQTPRVYFLDAPQGDPSVMLLPGNVTIMTDAGPNDTATDELQKILPANDSYIDLAIISYPEINNFEGYGAMLDHYQIGAFIYNGRNANDNMPAWQALIQKITAKHIPLITLGAGDVIHYGANEIAILSPDRDFDRSAALNDTGIVEMLKTPQFRALLAGDVGANGENVLLTGQDPIRADVVKVPFPESGDSSGDQFILAIDPKIVLVQPGIKNTPTHPSNAMLGHLASSTHALIARTDQVGTIEITVDQGKLVVLKGK